MSAADLLKTIPLFKVLSVKDLSELAFLLRVQRVKKGEVLFRKESEGSTLYIIQEGAIKIVLSSKLGDEVIVTLFSKGDFFGEMSLLDGMPRSADAIAMEPSRLLLLNRSDFLRFLKKSDAAMETILSSLTIRLRKTDDLLGDSSFLNIPARFAKKLLELGETFGQKEGDTMQISLRLSQKDLADMIGATRESINKELRTLREKGLVSITDKAISINNVNRLRSRIR
ncbi:Crp/Fnr family transcriptional regulator [Thermodesulfobacteriota bacterium]